MSQQFKKRFYKKIKIGNTDVYLFKHYEKYSPKHKWILFYMSACRDRKGKQFIVESGAGTTVKRMEKQITRHLERKMRKKGYF